MSTLQLKKIAAPVFNKYEHIADITAVMIRDADEAITKVLKYYQSFENANWA